MRGYRTCHVGLLAAGTRPGFERVAHDAFPELDPSHSCYVAVRYTTSGPRPDPTPQGGGYPRNPSTFDAFARAADRYERIADGDASSLPIDLACALPDETRRAAARLPV